MDWKHFIQFFKAFIIFYIFHYNRFAYRPLSQLMKEKFNDILDDI